MRDHVSHTLNGSGLEQKSMLHVRPARSGELEALSDLCLRSKAVWGYDQAFLDACKDELSISRDDLLTSDVVVAEAREHIVAVAQLLVDQQEADLLKLFVEPNYLRTGAGRTLFEWACETARAKGAKTLLIDSDPRAAEFYCHMGARKIGLAPSGSIPGRMLPMLEYHL